MVTFALIGTLFLMLAMTFGIGYASGFVYGRSASIITYALVFSLSDSFINSYVSRKTASKILLTDLVVGQVPHESFFEDFKSK